MILVNQLVVDVYSPADIKIGIIKDIISASFVRMVDGVGNFSLNVSVANQKAVELLVVGNRLRVSVQQRNGLRSVGGGIINSVKMTESGGSTQFVVSGPDFLQDLVVKSVLLNRAFDDLPVTTILSNLIALVPGWTASAESGLGNQTSRFDGASVFKAILRMAEEIGAHIRSLQDRVVEMGFFGQDSGLRIVNLGGTPTETDDNSDILVIDNIAEEETSDQLIDWIIPIGAGTGSSALTLKDSNRTSPYPIQTMVGPDGGTLYYLTSAPSMAVAKQRVVTFKQIGPISNSTLAKQLAANSLYDAAVAWLDMNNKKLVSYSVTCGRFDKVPRPGDRIRVIYKGKVRDKNSQLFSRIDVDDYFWVMRVEEKFGVDGSKLVLTICNIDKVNRDISDVIVGAIESIQSEKVTVQTFPFGFQDSSERIIQGGSSPADAQYRAAVFSLLIPDIFTDVISVKLRVLTRPLFSMTDVGPAIIPSVPYSTALGYWYAVYPSTNYPSDLALAIDGIDRTTELGGPWNPSGGNSPIDVSLDITRFIVQAAGGIYQNHTLVFTAGYKLGEVKVNTSHPSQLANASNGIVEVKILFLGTARAVIPVP